MSARPAIRLVALAAFALLAGCSHKAAPTAPVERLGPAFEQVFPPARATRVPLETTIWARFREPLDPATVTTTTVFLKHDTQRLAISLGYDAATRTLRVTPLVPLQLRHTYTVELSPKVATAAGATLDTTAFWQFTTTALRRLEHPWPLDGATGQSPFAALGWDVTEVGPVVYTVVTGDDSATVASRGPGAAVSKTNSGFQVADARRPALSTRFWSVGALAVDTGESEQGPVWRYTVAAADAPIDSLTVSAKSFCSVRYSSPKVSNCSSVSLTMGQNVYNCAIRWNLEAQPATLRLAGAKMLLWPLSVLSDFTGAAVAATTTDFDGCTATFAGPPTCVTQSYLSGVLAYGVYDPSISALVYRDDRFTAHLQCAVSFGAPYGYSLLSRNSFSVNSPGAANLPAILRLYYYRDPPAPPGAPASRAAPMGARRY